jgi:hypothetical protein
VTVPAGALHAVFTTRGGFLLGSNYTTGHDLMLCSYLLSIQLDRHLSDDDIFEGLGWYSAALEHALGNRHGDSLPLA